MKALRSVLALSAVVVTASFWGGCSSKAGGDTTGDEQDATQACKVFFVKENRFLTADEVSKLNDPIAKKVLTGTGCPTKLSEIVAKLNTTDAKNCVGGGSSSGGNGGVVGPIGKPDAGGGAASNNGMTSRFVSDASQEYSGPELEFMRTARSLCPNVGCVMTKIDFYPAWRKILDLDAGLAAASPLLPSVAGKSGPRAYVCVRGACNLPTTDPSVLRAQLLGGWGR